jgi:hypothetical protein
MTDRLELSDGLLWMAVDPFDGYLGAIHAPTHWMPMPAPRPEHWGAYTRIEELG